MPKPDKRLHINHPESFAVCMAFDAMRLCLGGKPINFTVDEVIRWLLAGARS